jgi:hypothetical protein
MLPGARIGRFVMIAVAIIVVLGLLMSTFAIPRVF